MEEDIVEIKVSKVPGVTLICWSIVMAILDPNFAILWFVFISYLSWGIFNTRKYSKMYYSSESIVDITKKERKEIRWDDIQELQYDKHSQIITIVGPNSAIKFAPVAYVNGCEFVVVLFDRASPSVGMAEGISSWAKEYAAIAKRQEEMHARAKKQKEQMQGMKKKRP